MAFNPKQPRIPAGHSDGGQFAPGFGASQKECEDAIRSNTYETAALYKGGKQIAFEVGTSDSVEIPNIKN